MKKIELGHLMPTQCLGLCPFFIIIENKCGRYGNGQEGKKLDAIDGKSLTLGWMGDKNGIQVLPCEP
jgi:hypothetical protein